jgi:ornithine cyclodeaminase/alanine dehydrogenase-like protein (mu-crystallin family)
MTPVDVAPLRYLSSDDVLVAMPTLDERLALAERTMTALASGAAELPPKIGVHPRPEGSFAHAMPAHLRSADGGAADDLLGIKWVAGFGANAALGRPAISALAILNDPATGEPLAILDGGPITAQRTAAVSGVAIRRFAPAVRGRSTRVALIGAGVQGRSHLPVLGAVLPGLELAIHDRHDDRADALTALARDTAGIGEVRVASSAREATAAADVVVTAASFTSPAERQAMTRDWLAADALVVAVDYATFVTAEVARDAALFVVDDRGQFLANRDAGQFDGYPDPMTTLGEAILAGTPRPATGRVLVTHLGVGLADVIFGDAILRRATEAGLGVILPR